jgi:rare lipoprotein A
VRWLLALVVLALCGCSLVGYPAGAPAPVASAPAAASGAGSGGGDAVAPGGVGLTEAEVAAIPDAVPRDEPLSPYGNPPEYEVEGRTYRVMRSSEGYEAEGIASWYGPNFHGRRTSSGEPYDMYRPTAAHRTLPIPTYVEVTNLENGRRVVVRVNDRGPFHDGRIIDLSYLAARKLGFVGAGTARVRVRALEPAAR